MATRKNPKISLPKQWTTAQVRVNPQGKVQVKIAANKLKGKKWFVTSDGRAYGPHGGFNTKAQALHFTRSYGIPGKVKITKGHS